jgi:Putative Flp pilus-assembly TadE/G-like
MTGNASRHPASMLTHRKTHRPSCRGGNVLIYFACLTLGLMAIAGLVIDVGYARLTQHEMQTAAETAALEGLRYRDDLPAAWRPSGTTTPTLPPALVAQCGPQPATAYEPTNPAWQEWCDCARRYAASTTVSLMFDDDLNPADGDTLQLGAGPTAEVTDTIGDELEAAGIAAPVGSPPVYKPALQSNPSNIIVGDLAAGQYSFNPLYNPTYILDEDSNYNRRDFVPDNPTGTLPETGFLARLRRSNENFSAETGVASNGPTLPFLFGRGSMMARSSESSTDLTVSSGMTVRATGIAAAGSVTLPAQGSAASTTVQMGHVLVVGPVDPVNLITGVAPFGLTATYWSSLVNPANTSPGTDTPTVNPTTGIITSALVPPGGGTTNPNATEAGVVGATQTIVEAIGQVYAAAGSDAPLSQSPSLYLYVPIYDTIGTTPRTIVAFGYVQWSYTTGALSLTVPWNTTTNLPLDHVASENATASLVMQWPTTITGSVTASTLIQQMFDENLGLSGALLAPVIASHYFGPSTVP